MDDDFGGSFILGCETSAKTSLVCTCEANQAIEQLKRENSDLREGLSNYKSFYNQLVREQPKECHDERRVLILKAQVLQLERQIYIWTECWRQQADFLRELSDTLQQGIDQCRGGASNTDLEETLSAAKQKVDGHCRQKAPSSHPHNLASSYTKSFLRGGGGQTSWWSVVSGDLRHVNLGEVSRLESRLSTVALHLASLETNLTELADCSQTCDDLALGSYRLVPTSHLIKTRPVVTKCRHLLRSTATDLIHLSLLTPQAPWGPISRLPIGCIETDDIMKQLPSLPAAKTERVRQIVDTLVKATAYRHHVSDLQLEILTKEVKHNRDQIKQLCQAQGASILQMQRALIALNNDHESLVSPLRSVLSSYSSLRSSSTETTLRNFLRVCKHCLPLVEKEMTALTESRGQGDVAGAVEVVKTVGRLVRKISATQKSFDSGQSEVYGSLSRDLDCLRRNDKELRRYFNVGERGALWEVSGFERDEREEEPECHFTYFWLKQAK